MLPSARRNLFRESVTDIWLQSTRGYPSRNALDVCQLRQDTDDCQKDPIDSLFLRFLWWSYITSDVAMIKVGCTRAENETKDVGRFHLFS